MMISLCCNLHVDIPSNPPLAHRVHMQMFWHCCSHEIFIYLFISRPCRDTDECKYKHEVFIQINVYTQRKAFCSASIYDHLKRKVSKS